jgi:hypothetical protein
MFTEDELPEVFYDERTGYAKAGEWGFDPLDEGDPHEAMEAAKAWAAYSIWLTNRALS